MITTTTTRRESMAFPAYYRDWQWLAKLFESKGIPPNARGTLDDCKVIVIEWEE